MIDAALEGQTQFLQLFVLIPPFSPIGLLSIVRTDPLTPFFVLVLNLATSTRIERRPNPSFSMLRREGSRFVFFLVLRSSRLGRVERFKPLLTFVLVFYQTGSLHHSRRSSAWSTREGSSRSRCPSSLPSNPSLPSSPSSSFSTLSLFPLAYQDMRQKFDDTTDGSAVQTKGGDKVEKNQGAARAISSFIDPGLSWKDLDFFKSITNSESQRGRTGRENRTEAGRKGDQAS